MLTHELSSILLLYYELTLHRHKLTAQDLWEWMAVPETSETKYSFKCVAFTLKHYFLKFSRQIKISDEYSLTSVLETIYLTFPQYEGASRSFQTESIMK
jgi:hypothetical protein